MRLHDAPKAIFPASVKKRCTGFCSRAWLSTGFLIGLFKSYIARELNSTSETFYDSQDDLALCSAADGGILSSLDRSKFQPDSSGAAKTCGADNSPRTITDAEHVETHESNPVGYRCACSGHGRTHARNRSANARNRNAVELNAGNDAEQSDS